jgi:hypothetical protein
VEQAGNLESLGELCKRLFGRPLAIRLESEAPAALSAQESGPKTHRALDDPRVRLLTETFPGKISIEDLKKE